MKTRLVLLIIFMLFVSFCSPHNEKNTSVNNDMFTYDLNNPDANYKLPSYLEEISGLSYYGKDKIACIQD